MVVVVIVVVVVTRTELGRRSFSVAAPTVWNSLPAHLSVSVCNAVTFESLDIESSISFVYEGHWVKVKVTRNKVVQNPYSCNVKLRSTITPVLCNIQP